MQFLEHFFNESYLHPKRTKELKDTLFQEHTDCGLSAHSLKIVAPTSVSLTNKVLKLLLTYLSFGRNGILPVELEGIN
jgi:hypothetical protein